MNKELFIILGKMRREEASLVPVCLSLKSCYQGSGPHEEAIFGMETAAPVSHGWVTSEMGGRQPYLDWKIINSDAPIIRNKTFWP